MKPLFIAGPCVIESTELLDRVAQQLVEIRQRLHIDIYFKASFDKATALLSVPSEDRGWNVVCSNLPMWVRATICP